MTHIERIEALLAGKKLDSTAINLWKHFPPYDEKPTTDLVKKCIQFQDRFDWDFVKITYHGYNSIQDWGAQIAWPVRDCEWPNTTSKVGINEAFTSTPSKGYCSRTTPSSTAIR